MPGAVRGAFQRGVLMLSEDLFLKLTALYRFQLQVDTIQASQSELAELYKYSNRKS